MKPLYTLVAGITLALIAGNAGIAGSGSPQDTIRVIPPGRGRVVIAAEDSTLLEIPMIDVVADTVPLIEIIRKAQAGERRKLEGLSTLSFNQTFKVTMSYTGKKPKMECMERTSRAFYRAPDSWRVVTLRDSSYQVGPDGRRAPWKDGEEGVRVSSSDDDDRDLTQLPYYLERLDKFRFRIAHRSVSEGRIVYEVDFEPLSDFDVLPGGKLWLLTPDYQIVREEFRLKNLPAPWILKGVDLLTRDWQNVNGRWVVKRITGRVELGLNFLKVPNSIEFIALYDHYEFNSALDGALFKGGR